MPSRENGGDRGTIQTQTLDFHLLQEIGTFKDVGLIRSGFMLL